MHRVWLRKAGFLSRADTSLDHADGTLQIAAHTDRLECCLAGRRPGQSRKTSARWLSPEGDKRTARRLRLEAGGLDIPIAGQAQGLPYSGVPGRPPNDWPIR